MWRLVVAMLGLALDRQVDRVVAAEAQLRKALADQICLRAALERLHDAVLVLRAARRSRDADRARDAAERVRTATAGLEAAR